MLFLIIILVMVLFFLVIILINFIVVEDNLKHRNSVEKMIVNYMMKNKLDFKIFSFEKVTEEFKKIVEEQKNKIYVLDFELPGTNALEISRTIRRCDWRSPIIILTAHGGMALESFKQRLQILDFISKQYEAERNLIDALDVCLNQVLKYDSLKFSYKHLEHNILFENILYIYRDTAERKVIIVTKSDKYISRMPLKEVKENLPNYFKYSDKACIINIRHVEICDWKNSIIKFNNGVEIKFLSKTHKKELSLQWKF